MGFKQSHGCFQLLTQDAKFGTATYSSCTFAQYPINSYPFRIPQTVTNILVEYLYVFNNIRILIDCLDRLILTNTLAFEDPTSHKR